MPRMLPASYIHLFQTIISQTHAEKFRQHFGDGRANASSLLVPPQADDVLFMWHQVAGSAAQVADSDAMTT